MNASDHAPAGQSDVLRSAWKRMTELSLQSSKISKQSTQLRKWIAILGVVATFLAILTNELRGEVYPIVEQILRGALIIVPIIISVMAAYTNKFFGGANGLVMRAGAEEIKKEIYLYRTVLRNHPERDKWLSRRLTTIQRRTYKSLGGELIIEPYEGKLPKDYNPDDPNSDPGFTDLTGDEYMRYRVIDQRDWHRRKNIQLKEERIRIQMIILVMGGVGALLAAIPPEWTPAWSWASWVALTAAIASAFTGWEQLRGLDKIVTIYSRVILELTIIRDEWEAIPAHQRTELDFVNMVRAAEDVMWAQNMQYISAMQEAITSGQGDEAELVENMLKESDAMTFELQSKMLEEAKGVLKVASEELGKVVEESATTVKGLVTTVSTTATGIQEKVKDTVETEVFAFDDMVGSGLERVTAETAAVRTTVTQTVDTAMGEVASTRQMVETTSQAASAEAAALRATVQTTVDAALAESAATREAVQTTTDTVVTQVGAVREIVQDSVAKQAAATRATVEVTAAAVSAEADVVRETIQETISDQALSTRELVESTSQAFAAETAALHHATQASAGAILENSAALRETTQVLTEQITAEAANLRESASQTVHTAIAPTTPPSSETGTHLREMLEEELTKQAKEVKKKGEAKRTAEAANESLDALLGEAQTLIDEAADEMKTKMAEAVVQEIAGRATEKKGPKGRKAKTDQG
ncbi:MAG: hypothetical protein Fur0022_25700 [Anaerolineales bacterium]